MCCCRGFYCQFIKMKAVIVTEMSEGLLRPQAFSGAGVPRFVLGEFQEVSLRISANLQWVSVRAPVIAYPFFGDPSFGSLRGTFCVSLWELSQTLHLFKSMCLHLIVFHQIMNMPRGDSWGPCCWQERCFRAKHLYSFLPFLRRNLDL